MIIRSWKTGLLAAALTVVGCTKVETTDRPTPDSTPDTEMSVQHHDPKGSAALLESDSSIKVLDVRTPAEFADGHLAGATLVDFKADNFREEVGKLDKDQTWLVHCRSGGRSMGAVQVMQELGFANLHHMDEGMLGWEAAGLPTEK